MFSFKYSKGTLQEGGLSKGTWQAHQKTPQDDPADEPRNRGNFVSLSTWGLGGGRLKPLAHA